VQQPPKAEQDDSRKQPSTIVKPSNCATSQYSQKHFESANSSNYFPSITKVLLVVALHRNEPRLTDRKTAAKTKEPSVFVMNFITKKLRITLLRITSPEIRGFWWKRRNTKLHDLKDIDPSLIPRPLIPENYAVTQCANAISNVQIACPYPTLDQYTVIGNKNWHYKWNILFSNLYMKLTWKQWAHTSETAKCIKLIFIFNKASNWFDWLSFRVILC